jgi:hypothetical protein
VAGAEFFSKKRMFARLTALAERRAPHLKDWQKITQVIRPARGTYLEETDSEVSKRPTSMINSTPATASRTLSAGMIGGASSPAYEWFKFELDDSDLNKWGPAKVALEQRERIVQRYLAASNFYQMMETLYGDAGDFGTGVGIIDRHPRDLFTCKVFSPGQYYIDVDEHGDIDTIYMKYQESVINIMSRWKDSASARVKEAYDKGNYNQKFTLIQVIEPNQIIDPDRGDWHGKPWVKFIFEENVKDEGENFYLETSGFEEWPGFNLRWELASGNIWGWGPGLLALGDAAALQTVEFRDAQGIEKAVKPMLQAPIFLKNQPISQTPGGVTYVDPYQANQAKVEPIYQIQPGILQALIQSIERHERRINEVYFKDLFLMLATTDRREITAREVEEKHQEKLLNLGPVLMRTHRDALNNAIIRIYRILDSAGVFPPAPPELKQRALSVRYVSSLAYAQRAAGASALERFFGFTGNLAGVYPQVIHKVDIFQGLDYYADAVGVPAEVMVSSDDAKASAQQQAAAQAAPAQAAAGKDAASAAQLLSQTDTTRPSALQYLLSRSGQ